MKQAKPGSRLVVGRTSAPAATTMRRFSSLALALVASAAAAFAQEFKAGEIVVEKPWARATPKGAEVGAGFLVVRNTGATLDRLTVGSADFAAVEIMR